MLFRSKAKSDQLNAVDLLGVPMTIKITEVKVVGGDQPVFVHYEGDSVVVDGKKMRKPWKPSKGMRRVLMALWGDEGDNYVGKKLTLYNAPEVTWAGEAIGGIKISHASDIKAPSSIPLRLNGKQSVLHKVAPIHVAKQNVMSKELHDALVIRIDLCKTVPELAEIAKEVKAENYDSSKDALLKYYSEAMAELRNPKTEEVK